MNEIKEFMTYFDRIKEKRKFRLDIFSSNKTGWHIQVLNETGSNPIVKVWDDDMEGCFRKAGTLLKDYVTSPKEGIL